MIAINSKKIIISGITLITWFALALQQYILIGNTPGNGMTPIQAVARFLIYFTILSNLMVAICLTVLVINPGSGAGKFFSRASVQTAIAVYIFIVGLTYNIILRGTWEPTGKDRLADELLHVVVPLLFTLYWLFLAPKSPLQWKHILQWLIFPATYLVYALVRGSIEDFYAYPFIDINKLGYGRVFLNSAILLLAFVIIGMLFIAIARSSAGKAGRR